MSADPPTIEIVDAGKGYRHAVAPNALIGGWDVLQWLIREYGADYGPWAAANFATEEAAFAFVEGFDRGWDACLP